MVPGVTILCKSWLELSPPVLTVIRSLCHLQKQVTCICSGCRAETKAELEKLGVSVEQVHPEDPFPRDNLGRVLHYARFRKRAWRILDNKGQQELTWVARIDTAIALGKRLLERPYVLSIHELHDKNLLYQRAIGLYARNASVVVVPEFCRASILRCWHDLSRTPFVLPNRPLLTSRERNIAVSDPEALATLDSIPKARRILLYQGALDRDRNIEPVARAAHQLGKDYCLLIMGEDRTKAMERLRHVCPDVMYIPWVRPPAHLQITSHAHIGIAFYRFDALNSIFCAPNKIWEYSAYGIPMICQDIPGLRYTVGMAGAGICVDSECPEAIVAGLKAIDANYPYYSRKATEFYDSVDTEAIVSRIITDALPHAPGPPTGRRRIGGVP